MKKRKQIPRTRFEAAQQDNVEGLIKTVITICIIIGVIFWITKDIEPITNDFEDFTEDYEVEEPMDYADEYAESVEDESEREAVIDEKKSVNFYYERALERENSKDYQGAIEDYGQTISMAKKYSAEMWYSLNNRGIILAEQFKDYKGAIKDFNKVIEIENNRFDGEINATRLESGYLNRAYVKSMMGNNDGACDDLYEALGLGVESSSEFIDEQINKVCL